MEGSVNDMNDEVLVRRRVRHGRVSDELADEDTITVRSFFEDL